MTIKELLNQAVIMLKNENIDAPKNKARMLLQATLKKSREYLMIYDNKEVENIDRDRYIKNVKRLILGEPLQYIRNTRIYEIKFSCNKRCVNSKTRYGNFSRRSYKKG